MNKKQKTSRRSFVYPSRSSSWPRLSDVQTGSARFDLPQMQVELLRSRHNLDMRNDVTSADSTTIDSNNDASVTLNTSIHASIAAMRYTSFYESSNPFLPESGLDVPCRTSSRGQSHEHQRRSSSLASSSQRSLRLAEIIQEAIDISSTIQLSEDGDEDDPTDGCDVHDQ